MRRAVVILEVSEEWVQSMAPAAHWLDSLIDYVNRGIGPRGEVATAYRDAVGHVVLAIDVSEEWIQSMAPSFEWLGFLAARIKRGIDKRGEVVNAYEIDGLDSQKC